MVVEVDLILFQEGMVILLPYHHLKVIMVEMDEVLKVTVRLVVVAVVLRLQVLILLPEQRVELVELVQQVQLMPHQL